MTQAGGRHFTKYREGSQLELDISLFFKKKQKEKTKLEEPEVPTGENLHGLLESRCLEPSECIRSFDLIDKYLGQV